MTSGNSKFRKVEKTRLLCSYAEKALDCQADLLPQKLIITSKDFIILGLEEMPSVYDLISAGFRRRKL